MSVLGERTAPAAPAAPVELDRRRILAVMSSLLVGMFLAALDQTVVATALPTIVGDLGGLDQLSWVVTAYMLTSTASTPIWGKLGDLHGRRRLFQLAIVIFVVSSVLAGLAQSMWALVLLRGVQGIGGGGLVAMAFAIVGDVLSPRERGRYMGLFSAVFAVASVAGPLVGGFAVDHLSWRWIFYVNVPVGAAALAVTSRIPSVVRSDRRHPLDTAGAALLVSWVTCLLLVSIWGGQTFPWGSAEIVALTAAGVALLVMFVVREQRAADPVLPLRLFRNRSVAVGCAVAACTGTAMFGAVVFLPLFLQAVSGVSAINSGLLLAPLMLALTVSSVFSGRAISRLGRYKRFVVAGAAMLVAAMAMLTTIGPATSPWTIAVYMVVVGVGMGMHMPVINLSTQNAVDHADLGTATSTLAFTRSLGGAFGITVFGAIMASRLQDNLAGIGVRAAAEADRLVNGPEQIRSLAEPLRSGVVASLADAISVVYVAALPLVAAALVLALLLPELPLRDRAAVVDAGDVAAP